MYDVIYSLYSFMICHAIWVFDTQKLKVFEIWVYSKILRFSWTERVTSEELNDLEVRSTKMNKNRLKSQRTMKCRKITYFGHVLRMKGNRLLHLIMQNKWEKNSRKKNSCLAEETWELA